MNTVMNAVHVIARMQYGVHQRLGVVYAQF